MTAVRNLAMGQSGEVTVTCPAQECRRAMGHRTKAAEGDTLEGSRLHPRRGRAAPGDRPVRPHRREAEAAIEAAVAGALVSSDVPITRSMTLLAAGQYWLEQIARPDSRLSSRTIADYTWTWATYVEARTSSLRGLTLHQANDPQRLRGFLQRVAEAHGSASAKKAKSVLNGVLAYAVDSGVLASNAMRQVRTVASTAPRTAQTRPYASHDPS